VIQIGFSGKGRVRVLQKSQYTSVFPPHAAVRWGSLHARSC